MQRFWRISVAVLAAALIFLGLSFPTLSLLQTLRYQDCETAECERLAESFAPVQSLFLGTRIVLAVAIVLATPAVVAGFAHRARCKIYAAWAQPRIVFHQGHADSGGVSSSWERDMNDLSRGMANEERTMFKGDYATCLGGLLAAFAGVAAAATFAAMDAAPTEFAKYGPIAFGAAVVLGAAGVLSVVAGRAWKRMGRARLEARMRELEKLPQGTNLRPETAPRR